MPFVGLPNRALSSSLPVASLLAAAILVGAVRGVKMLEVAGLSHTYANGTVALNDVTLSIPRGMFGLLGPNGAGKSTLMRTVASLQSPTAGSIRFGDIDVLAEPERLRRTLGYLPQIGRAHV